MTTVEKLKYLIEKAETSDLLTISSALGDDVRADHIHTHLEGYLETPSDLMPVIGLIDRLYAALINS
jgi:hypothetical protein